MSIFQILRNNKNSFLLLLLLFILPFIASSFIVYAVIKHESLIRNFTMVQWLMIYLTASLTMAFALTHTTFVALIGGFFLGWTSLLLMLPAYILASTIGFLTAKLIDKGSFIQSIESIPGVERIIRNLKKKEGLIIFFCRISPVLPFAMMNALLSILNAELKKYLTAGSLGMLPRTLLFVWIGIQGRNLQQLLEHPGENIWSKISFIVLMVVSVFGLFYIFKKIFEKVEKQELQKL